MPETVSRRAVATGLAWTVPAVVATSALPSYAASTGCLAVSFSSSATACPTSTSNGNNQASTLTAKVTNNCGAPVVLASAALLTITVSAVSGTLDTADFGIPTPAVGTISEAPTSPNWTWTIPSGTTLTAGSSLTASLAFKDHQKVHYAITLSVTSGAEYFTASSYTTSSGFTLSGGGTCTRI